jgi:hypothetical protein
MDFRAVESSPTFSRPKSGKELGHLGSDDERDIYRYIQNKAISSIKKTRSHWLLYFKESVSNVIAAFSSERLTTAAFECDRKVLKSVYP